MKSSQNPILLFIGAFSLIAFSCQNQQKESPEHLSVEITDSIRVDYAGLLNLMDVQPSQERILLYDPQRGTILMTDFNGKQLLTLDKRGDQKDSYGRYLWSTAKIKEDDHISLVSHKGFFEFDAEGNLVKQQPFQDEVPFFAGPAAADSELLEHEGILLQKGLVARGEYNKTQDEYYDQFQLIVKFDPEKGSAERIVNLEETSPFRTTGRAYEISEMNPCFAILDDNRRRFCANL